MGKSISREIKFERDQRKTRGRDNGRDGVEELYVSAR